MLKPNKVYRNTLFTKRDFEATNIVACEQLETWAKIESVYEEADASILEGLSALWVIEGVRYYGYL